jgi:hypothetical protein
MSVPWVENAMEWLSQQPGQTGGDKNLKHCSKAWEKLATGQGVSSPSRPGDPFCEGVCVDPDVHNIAHLYRQSFEWLWPRKPSDKTGPVPGRIYDKERGWKVNTQLMLLERYCKARQIDCESKIRIVQPFKGDPDSVLTKRASEVKPPPNECTFTPNDSLAVLTLLFARSVDQ